MKIERIYETTTAKYVCRGTGGAGWWYMATHKGEYGYGETKAVAVKNLRHNWTCSQCRRLRVTGHF